MLLGLIGQMRIQYQTSSLSLFTEVDLLEPVACCLESRGLKPAQHRRGGAPELQVSHDSYVRDGWPDQCRLRKLFIKITEDF